MRPNLVKMKIIFIFLPEQFYYLCVTANVLSYFSKKLYPLLLGEEKKSGSPRLKIHDHLDKGSNQTLSDLWSDALSTWPHSSYRKFVGMKGPLTHGLISVSLHWQGRGPDDD